MADYYYRGVYIPIEGDLLRRVNLTDNLFKEWNDSRSILYTMLEEKLGAMRREQIENSAKNDSVTKESE